MRITRYLRPAIIPLLALGVLAFLLAQAEYTRAVTPSPLPLNANAATDVGQDLNPSISTDGSGTWLAVWRSPDNLGGTIGADFDILAARSTDNGNTWSGPAALNTNAASDVGLDRFPQVLSAGSGEWLSIWQSDDSLAGTIGTDFDILVSRSTDGGLTWTAPAALNTDAATDSLGDHDPTLETDGAGNWVAAWVSGDPSSGFDWDLRFSRSIDNGNTWTVPASLNTNAASDSGGDTRPQVAADGSGNWVAVWRSDDDLGASIGVDGDILVSRSSDNGATWSAPAAVNANAATDVGDDDVPELATDMAGNWVAVWASDDTLGGTVGLDLDIFVSRSTDDGATWSAPAPLNVNALTDLGLDFAPDVTTDGSGNWVTVWGSADSLASTIGVDRDILFSRSSDSGATWTSPTVLNTNASGDSGTDGSSQIATDGAGNWVTVWISDDSLGGSIGTDFDVLYTNCSPLDTDCDGTPESGPGALAPTPSPPPGPPAVGGMVELVTGSSDSRNAQPRGGGHESGGVALAVALGAVGIAGVSWRRYRRRVGSR